MIVGCYTLELYCDLCWNDPAKPYAQRSGFPHRYLGTSRARCARQARTAGWLLQFARANRPEGAICPICRKNPSPSKKDKA